MNMTTAIDSQSNLDINNILLDIIKKHPNQDIQMLAMIIRGLLLARENDQSYMTEQNEN